MYSRKFGQNELPPDYGGISFRRSEEMPPLSDPPPAPRSAYDLRPAKEAPKPPAPSHSFRFKRKFEPKHKEKPPVPERSLPKEKEKKSGLSALTSHSFTMEDILLAGLILLLLNSDCNSELLLILGFLLLVGLQ